MVQDLYILMITAAVVSILFKLLKQPVVLGYIVAGVLVGPYLFGKTFVNADNVKSWGDIGVLFVLFCIGLEFRLKNLISSGKVAAIGALTIIVGMMLLGYGVGKDADFDMVNSLFLAGMLCMSSTTIVMKAIDEAGLSKERFVKGATSILIVEDVVAVVLMVLLSSIAIRHQFEGAELAAKVLDLAITLAAWFICGILIIPTLIRKVKKHLNDETLIILALGLFRDGFYPCRDSGVASYRKTDDTAEECLCCYLLHICGYADQSVIIGGILVQHTLGQPGNYLRNDSLWHFGLLVGRTDNA